jgi:hypothetical protein
VRRTLLAGQPVNSEAVLHGEVALNYMPLDLVSVATGVAESLQHFVHLGGQSTQLSLELDSNLPLSVNGDITKVGGLC